MISARGAISVPVGLNLPYLNDYMNTPLDTQEIIKAKYGDYVLDIDTDDINEALPYYDGMYRGLFFYNDYKYRTMYDTIIQEYNPIENYDRIEETTVKGTSNTSSSGQVTTQATDNVNVTSNSSTNNPSITQTIGGVNVDVTEQGTTFDSTSFKPKSHTENVTSSQTNTTSYDKDTTTQGESSTTSDSDEVKTSSDTSEGSTSTTTTSRVHGNIGVTTAAQMLEAQRQLALFSFYEVIIKDFIEVACKLVY